VAFEPFFAVDAAEMVGFSFVRDFEFGGVLIQHHAANGVPEFFWHGKPQT
jgi:hypothetical protein